MRSVERDQASDGASSVMALLAPAFGFIVWAAHFLLVYCLTAVACAMGWDTRAMMWTVVAQVAVTVAALAVIALHAFLAARPAEGAVDRRFMRRLTLGCDAVAAFGVVLMLGPVLLTPGCA